MLFVPNSIAMPPRGEGSPSRDVQEAMAEVHKMEAERAEAARSPEERVADIVALWSRSDREHLRPEDLTESLAQMDRIVRDIELLSSSSAEQGETLRLADEIVKDVESRAAKRGVAEQREWQLRLQFAKDLHDLAESVNDAEQLTWEAVVESQRAPEQIGLQMRLDAARSAQRSYEALAGQVYELLKEGKNLPQGHREQLIDQGKRLLGLIKHERQIVGLAERNFQDNLEAQVAAAEEAA